MMKVEHGGGGTEFSEVLAKGLTTWGDDLLRNPKRLVGYMSDLLDTECIELRVLYTQCDDELLDPFLSIDYSDVNALRHAEGIMFERLRTERLVEEGAARRTAHGVATGIALWAGIPYSTFGESSSVSSSRAEEESASFRQTSPEVQQSAAALYADLDEPDDPQKRRVLPSQVPLVDEQPVLWPAPKKIEPISFMHNGPGAIIRKNMVRVIVVLIVLGVAIFAARVVEEMRDESYIVHFEYRDADATDSPSEGEGGLDFHEMSGVPENTSIPIKGSFGVWADGVYTSEVLGIRITPNGTLVPMYESSYYGLGRFDDLDSMRWSEFCYSAELDKSSITPGQGMVACPVTLRRWSDQASFDGKELELDGETLEQIEFCGSRWFVEDVSAEPGDFHRYFKQVNNTLVYIEIPVLRDEEANEQVMSAFSTL